MNDDLCLPAAYRSRPANNAGFEPPPAGMEPVYKWIAKAVAWDRSIRTVLDWGCGSGAMLLKFFGHLDTLGVDVAWRLPALKSRWPNRRWTACDVPADADLVLCVDVIEHLDDPLDLLQRFAAGRWRHLVITTPDRALVARYKGRTRARRKQQLLGPPLNVRHTREWTASEFAQLLTREIRPPQIVTIGRFNVIAIFHS